MPKLRTMAQIKRSQLNQVHQELITIRSSAYLFHNIPEECLIQVECACAAMERAIYEYNKVITE